MIARCFQRQVGKAHVHDLAAENVRYAEHLAALGFFSVDLDDHHFPFNIGHPVKVDDLDDRHQLAQLLDDLFDDLFVAAGGDGHERNPVLKGGGHIERLDVETATAEQSRHTREDTRFILNKYRQNAPHSSSKSC